MADLKVSMDLAQCDQGWVAVQVRPRYEFVAARVLRGKGYEEFVPTCSSKRRWSDRTKEIITPLFSGYVFCKLDKKIPYPVISTPGVIRIVGPGGRIAPIEESEIEAIRVATNSGCSIQPCDYLNVGDRIRVASGPLHGLEGFLINRKSRHCMVISVNLIQKSIAVEVDGHVLTGVAPLAGTRQGARASNAVSFSCWRIRFGPAGSVPDI